MIILSSITIMKLVILIVILILVNFNCLFGKQLIHNKLDKNPTKILHKKHLINKTPLISKNHVNSKNHVISKKHLNNKLIHKYTISLPNNKHNNVRNTLNKHLIRRII